MFEKYNLNIATILEHEDWVKARARELDLNTEWHLAVKLDQIMQYYRALHRFAGASSNNIKWNQTRTPIRVVHIPTSEQRYITIVNPEVIALDGKNINSIEACGSIPDQHYEVKRKSYIFISGYSMEKRSIKLEYGAVDGEADKNPKISSYNDKATIVQHEMDHLDGITIKDKGRLFDLNKLMS